MTYWDLEHGWTDQRFVLTEIKIRSDFWLYERNKEGKWEVRMPVWNMSEDEQSVFENPKELTCSEVFRSLTAKAAFPDDQYGVIHIGVPEDKVHDAMFPSLEFFELYISEKERDFGLAEAVKLGYMKYSDPDPEDNSPASIYAHLFVTACVFDQIEQLASKPDCDMYITLNLKCWNYTGPISDRYIYIDPEDDIKAEFLGFKVTRKVS